MESSQRFIASRLRRRSYDVERRQVISRRQYLKLQGVFPEAQARRSRSAVIHRSRSDKGCPRSPAQVGTERRQPFVKLVRLPDGRVVEVRPVGGQHYRVFVGLVYVAPLRVELRGTRRQWHCQMPGCEYHERNQEAIARHCYRDHYQALSCFVEQRPEKVWYTGDVRTNERRARMPWRLVSPEHERRRVTRSHGSVC